MLLLMSSACLPLGPSADVTPGSGQQCFDMDTAIDVGKCLVGMKVDASQ